MRRFAIALLAATALSTTAFAQLPAGQFSVTSAHEITACADSADQPVCILRALAHFPTHSPYRTDWRLAGADNVLAALGEGEPHREQNRYSHIPYASTRFVYGYMDDQDTAVAAAIIAERRGASPERALEHIRTFRAFAPETAGALRCQLYKDVWQAHGSEAQRRARPSLPRPSTALTRAAVAACERENAAPEAVHPYEMARVYAMLGDRESAVRIMARDPRPPELVRAETAFVIRDFSAAAEAARVAPRLLDVRHRARFVTLRDEIIGEARAQGQAGLVAALAVEVLDDFFENEEHGANTTGLAVAALVDAGRRDLAIGYAERLDAHGRDTRSARSFHAAQGAVRGWLALDQPAKARAIVDVWLSRAQEENAPGRGCGRGQEISFCAGFGVAAMLVRLGDVGQAMSTPHASAGTILRYAFANGRGLQDLDMLLARSGSERAADELLRDCVDSANWTQQQLRWAETCARRLIERTRQNAAEPDLRRRKAADAALEVSDLAARQGEFGLMQEMLDAALSRYGVVANFALAPKQRASLLEIAIAQLDAAGRL